MNVLLSREREIYPAHRCRDVLTLYLDGRAMGSETPPQLVRNGAVFAGRQRLGYQAFGYMVVAEEVASLAHDDDEQVHPALLALVAGLGELGVVARRRIEPSAPAGCV